MERYIHERLKILELLRGNKESATLVADLLHKYGGKLPRHTGAGIFGGCIACLFDTGYIDLLDSNGQNINKEFSTEYNPYQWYINYSFADKFRDKEEQISVVLTDKLEQLQSVFGVSLSRLLKEQQYEAMIVYPLFGKPWRDHKTDVFVLMPFHDKMAPIFDDHIRNVCDSLELSVKRADDIFGSSKIIKDIWELITNSKIIIADCTGKNPNVFYELGIAHTLGKNVIITTQSPEDIPFDINHIRYIKYEYTPRGMSSFETTLKEYIKEEMNKLS